MSYIDTSVIVAALDPADPRSRSAKRVLEEEGYKVVSELVLAELASVLSRREALVSSLAHRLRLSEALTILAILLYLLQRFNLKYRAVESRARALPFGRTGAPTATAIELSATLRLKTLDLLHAAYVKLLKDQGEPIFTLKTADTDFKGVEEQLKSTVGVSVSIVKP